MRYRLMVEILFRMAFSFILSQLRQISKYLMMFLYTKISHLTVRDFLFLKPFLK
jgi:hypothetical protein